MNISKNVFTAEELVLLDEVFATCAPSDETELLQLISIGQFAPRFTFLSKIGQLANLGHRDPAKFAELTELAGGRRLRAVVLEELLAQYGAGEQA